MNKPKKNKQEKLENLFKVALAMFLLGFISLFTTTIVSTNDPSLADESDFPVKIFFLVYTIIILTTIIVQDFVLKNEKSKKILNIIEKAGTVWFVIFSLIYIFREPTKINLVMRISYIAVLYSFTHRGIINYINKSEKERKKINKKYKRELKKILFAIIIITIYCFLILLYRFIK